MTVYVQLSEVMWTRKGFLQHCRKVRMSHVFALPV